MIARYLSIGDPWGFRKIVGYLLFRIIFSLFGVNPLPFLLTEFFLHLGNTWLIFIIGRRLSRQWWGPLLGALIFNRLFLTYFSNLHEYLVVFFSLLAIYSTVREKPRLCLLTFILALLSKEVGIVSLVFLLNTKLAKKAKIISGIIGLLFVFWQAPAFISRFYLSPAHPYLADSRISSHIASYLPPGSVFILIIVFFLSARSRIWLVLASLSLLPVLFLANRREIYYLYLPLAYLGIFLSSRMPILNLKTSVIYLAVILIFGGRSFFPLIPRQIYPNWQKYSIDEVLTRIASSVPGNSEISLADLNLERDAKLLLGSQVLSDFLPQDLSSRYNFTYYADRNTVAVIPASD